MLKKNRKANTVLMDTWINLKLKLACYQSELNTGIKRGGWQVMRLLDF